LVRNLVKRLIPSLVPKRSVGIMLCSSLCRRCLCSSYSGHSVRICNQVWSSSLHGHDMSSGILKFL
jgi:hypothetical protein